MEQLTFALIAASMKSPNLAAGTRATTSSSMLVTVQPSSVRFDDVTVAVVVMRCAGKPA